jgi:hypothetical protein
LLGVYKSKIFRKSSFGEEIAIIKDKRIRDWCGGIKELEWKKHIINKHPLIVNGVCEWVEKWVERAKVRSK